MKTNLYIFSLVLFSVLLATSCEDIIDVNLHSVEPRLVIDGVIRMGETAQVTLTQTKDFDDNTPYIPLTNAVVKIADDAGNTEELQPNEEGRFVAQTITGVERRTYHLTVLHEEVEYTATTVMPPRVEIDSLTLWKFAVLDYWQPMVHFQDPKGEENRYYRFVISINGEHPRLEENLLSTEFLDGNVIHLPLFVFYEGGIDDDPIENGDEIGIEMRCMDKGVYTFFDTMDDVPNALANPTSNITGGALGYFGAYSYTNMSIVAEW